MNWISIQPIDSNKSVNCTQKWIFTKCKTRWIHTQLWFKICNHKNYNFKSANHLFSGYCQNRPIKMCQKLATQWNYYNAAKHTEFSAKPCHLANTKEYGKQLVPLSTVRCRHVHQFLLHSVSLGYGWFYIKYEMRSRKRIYWILQKKLSEIEKFQ